MEFFKKKKKKKRGRQEIVKGESKWKTQPLFLVTQWQNKLQTFLDVFNTDAVGIL